jgi:hypothetical protein
VLTPAAGMLPLRFRLLFAIEFLNPLALLFNRFPFDWHNAVSDELIKLYQ